VTHPVAPFPQALLDALRADPGTPAFEHAGREVTRGELLELVARCAAGLAAAGLGPGAPVALSTGVTPEAFAAQVAAYALGCRVTGLRPGLTPAQLAAVLGRGAQVLVADDAAPAAVLEAAGRAGVAVLRVAGLLRSGPAGGPRGDAALAARGRSGDVAIVNLTSGSTGTPKGCEQSYASLTRHWSWQPARWTARTAGLAAGYGRFLLFGTLTSAVMAEHLALCLFGGGTAVIPDGPPDFPAVLARHRITACLLTVPRLHQILDGLAGPPAAPAGERPDLSALRVLLVAGSPLAPHRLLQARDLVGPAVHQGYGQTETGMLTLLTPAELAQDPAGRADSVGRVCDGVDLEIRDPDGRPVPPGGTGEVWVRTPGAMSGYAGDPAQTAEVLRDGWVRTRDLGALDADGFLRLTGRSRDIVIVNAVVHYAGAIEQALAAHPAVDQAYVVAVPDERTGEAAHAFLVPAPGHRLPGVTELRAHVGALLGTEGVPLPAVAVPLEAVPVAPSGKPDKPAMLAAARATGTAPGGA
jgi:acyl-CoA synthetase (AMP-forming)/AMP-acid ligase II